MPNYKRSEIGRVFIEEYDYGKRQLQTLLIHIELLKTSNPETLSHAKVVAFARGAEELLTQSIAALDCLIPD